MEPGSPLVLQSTSWEGDTIYSWLYLRTFSRLFLASLEMYWGQTSCMKELSSNSIWCFLQLQQSPRELEQAFPAQYLGFLPFTANCVSKKCVLSRRASSVTQHCLRPWKKCPERAQPPAGVGARSARCLLASTPLHPLLDNAGKWRRARCSTFLPCYKNKEFMSMPVWKEGLGNHYWKHKRLIFPIKWQQ